LISRLKGVCRALGVLLFLALPALAQEPPLPEGNAFVRAALTSARPQEAAINDYSYDIQEVREKLDGSGQPASQESRRYEVFFIKTRPVRRLVSKNGVPLSPKEQAEVDRKAEAKANDIAAGRTVNEQPGVRLANLVDYLNFTTVGREMREGRQTLVFAFEPRPGLKRDSANRAASEVAKVLTGRLLIDELDRRVVLLEGRSAPGQKAEIAIGVNLGTLDIRMEFVQVEEGVWLPRQVVNQVSGRAYLFFKFRTRQTTNYSNYRKFRVDAEGRVK
jgi:hypothetical protein